MKFVEFLAVFFSIFFIAITFPLSIFFIFRVVKQYQRAVILRLGRVRPGSPMGPGMILILPCVDKIFWIDLRVMSLDVPPQEALTKDSVTVLVDAVVYYRIADPLLSVLRVQNYSFATFLLAMTMLRNMLGQKSFADILSLRESIASNLQKLLDDATDEWGVKVERVEIKDVSIPISMQRAMAAEAEAQREAKAKVIAAEGEMNASKAYKQAADIISKNPGAMQLRYLETLNTISADKESTIIFPLPIDIVSNFSLKKSSN